MPHLDACGKGESAFSPSARHTALPRRACRQLRLCLFVSALAGHVTPSPWAGGGDSARWGPATTSAQEGVRGRGGTDTQILVSHNPPRTQLCSLGEACPPALPDYNASSTVPLVLREEPAMNPARAGHSNRRLGSASLQLSLRPPRGWDSPGNTMHTSTAPHCVCGADDPGTGQATPWALRVRGGSASLEVRLGPTAEAERALPATKPDSPWLCRLGSPKSLQRLPFLFLFVFLLLFPNSPRAGPLCPSPLPDPGVTSTSLMGNLLCEQDC